MSDDHKKRRSSFFPKPVEESPEKVLGIFQNMNWVDEEKENVVSKSVLFGNQGKKTLQKYTDKLKCQKLEYPKLVSNKQEEEIYLKEKLRKSKIEIDWETACEGLTDFERHFADNRPNYKELVEKVHLLTIHTGLVKKANNELHTVLNAYNRRANEEIQKLQGFFIDKIVEDSGVGTSYNENDTHSSSIESSEDEGYSNLMDS